MIWVIHLLNLGHFSSILIIPTSNAIKFPSNTLL